MAGTIAAGRATRSKATNASTETTEKVVQEEQVELQQAPAAASPIKNASPLKAAAPSPSRAVASPVKNASPLKVAASSPSPAVVAREDSPITEEVAEDKIVSAVEKDSQQETEAVSSVPEAKEEKEEVVPESKTTEENLQVVSNEQENEPSSFETTARLVVLLSVILATFQDGNLGVKAFLIALVIALCRRLVAFVL